MATECINALLMYLDHKREQSGDDPCGRREQSPTALSRSSADAPNVATASLSQDLLLFQVTGDVSLFDSLAPALSQVWNRTDSFATIPLVCNASYYVFHPANMQRRRNSPNC